VTGVLADDGCRLWATEVGAGGPLIVCHGGPGLWDMFGSLADSLAGEVRMIRWDQRGCGRSDRRGPYNVARSVADLDAVRAGYGLDRAAVLGHSWGATLALRYALDHPDRVSALIVDGETDLRPRWAVDSLERALPRVTRVILPGVGHVPWLEKPGDVSSLLLEYLRRAPAPRAGRYSGER
jgi:pimeloyl-ACP methyl ester carboxylesterase